MPAEHRPLSADDLDRLPPRLAMSLMTAAAQLAVEEVWGQPYQLGNARGAMAGYTQAARCYLDGVTR